jgi:predicted GIY-YIG superfamily endonuclease
MVYQAVDEEGRVIYIGITNNLPRRAVEQLKAKGIEINEIDGLSDLSREDARAVEQVLIEAHGLVKEGGTLTNKINSIARSNPSYAQSLQRGQQIVQAAGQDAEIIVIDAEAVGSEVEGAL